VNLILFMVALFVSLLAVRVGAVALQLTGLEWSLAKFQALSCFSGTGFTTRESELIVGHPQRRRIASVLMVVGNAGFVAMIATFANSLRPKVVEASSRYAFLQNAMPWINVLIVVTALYCTYRFFTRPASSGWFTEFLRRRVKQTSIAKPVAFNELLIATGGYGVASGTLRGDHPLVTKSLRECGLRDKGIMVLAIQRQEETIPNPPADTCLLRGDGVICFGSLDRIRDEFDPKHS